MDTKERLKELESAVQRLSARVHAIERVVHRLQEVFGEAQEDSPANVGIGKLVS